MLIQNFSNFPLQQDDTRPTRRADHQDLRIRGAGQRRKRRTLSRPIPHQLSTALNHYRHAYLLDGNRDRCLRQWDHRSSSRLPRSDKIPTQQPLCTSYNQPGSVLEICLKDSRIRQGQFQPNSAACSALCPRGRRGSNKNRRGNRHSSSTRPRSDVRHRARRHSQSA